MKKFKERLFKSKIKKNEKIILVFKKEFKFCIIIDVFIKLLIIMEMFLVDDDFFLGGFSGFWEMLDYDFFNLGL